MRSSLSWFWTSPKSPSSSLPCLFRRSSVSYKAFKYPFANMPSCPTDSRQFKIKVPSTSANIGPGFDVVGLSLSLELILECNVDPYVTLATVSTYLVWALKPIRASVRGLELTRLSAFFSGQSTSAVLLLRPILQLKPGRYHPLIRRRRSRRSPSQPLQEPHHSNRPLRPPLPFHPLFPSPSRHQMHKRHPLWKRSRFLRSSRHRRSHPRIYHRST